MIFRRSKRSRLRFLNLSRNCIPLGCENWLITVNLLTVSGKAFHLDTALCAAVPVVMRRRTLTQRGGYDNMRAAQSA
jgi:hypothetical protein